MEPAVSNRVVTAEAKADDNEAPRSKSSFSIFYARRSFVPRTVAPAPAPTTEAVKEDAVESTAENPNPQGSTLSEALELLTNELRGKETLVEELQARLADQHAVYQAEIVSLKQRVSAYQQQIDTQNGNYSSEMEALIQELVDARQVSIENMNKAMQQQEVVNELQTENLMLRQRVERSSKLLEDASSQLQECKVAAKAAIDQKDTLLIDLEEVKLELEHSRRLLGRYKTVESSWLQSPDGVVLTRTLRETEDKVRQLTNANKQLQEEYNDMSIRLQAAEGETRRLRVQTQKLQYASDVLKSLGESSASIRKDRPTTAGVTTSRRAASVITRRTRRSSIAAAHGSVEDSVVDASLLRGAIVSPTRRMRFTHLVHAAPVVTQPLSDWQSPRKAGVNGTTRVPNVLIARMALGVAFMRQMHRKFDLLRAFNKSKEVSKPLTFNGALYEAMQAEKEDLQQKYVHHIQELQASYGDQVTKLQGERIELQQRCKTLEEALRQSIAAMNFTQQKSLQMVREAREKLWQMKRRHGYREPVPIMMFNEPHDLDISPTAPFYPREVQQQPQQTSIRRDEMSEPSDSHVTGAQQHTVRRSEVSELVDALESSIASLQNSLKRRD